jgi:hypothetical protein
MRWLPAIAAIAGCGRIHFDATADAGLGYRATVLADHPLSYWRLDETIASLAADQEAAQPGAYDQATLGVAGAIGDGDPAMAVAHAVGSRVMIADVYGFGGVAPFSLEVWGNAQSYAAVAGNYLFAKEGPITDPGPVQDGYTLRADTQLRFARTTAGMADVASAPLPAQGQWTYIVATYDGATMSLYVDGALAGTAPSSRSLTGTPGRTLAIGARSPPGGGSGWDGGIDEPAIYDRALSAADVARHYAARGS